MSCNARKETPFTPSKEQKRIAKLCRTKNVVVSARPGSGKTATAEAIIAAHPDLRVLVLTYSKRLQLETFRRLRPYPNCEVYTFHAMAGKPFGTVIRDDAALSEEIRRVLGCNELPKWSSAPFDIIVLDEFQDCTEVLFWLANCFILANNQKLGGEPARIVVLGDERQSIYGFRGADDRYLTLAFELLRSTSPYPFAEAQLSQSFRLSIQSVRFINEVFLGGESCITSTKTGPKPIVLRCHPYDVYALAKQLWVLIKHHGAQNTAILAPAVRKRGPVQDVVNILSKKYGVPIAVSVDDEVPLDDRVIEGKMCVSTIHQFKGSERDLVILFGIDASFFEFFGRNLPDDRCPNEIFVALTRAREQLVLVHHKNQKLMPFVAIEALYETADVIDMTTEQGRIAPPDAPSRALELGLALPRSITVRDMARHVKDELLDGIIERHLCVHKLPPLPDMEHIGLLGIVLSDAKMKFYEAVSDLNGLVVVAAFEYEISGTLATLNVKQPDIDSMPLLCSQEGVSWLCRQACKYEAELSGYLPRSIQMGNHAFDWIKPKDLAAARSRLWEELGRSVASLRFEFRAEDDFIVEDQKAHLLGRADIVDVSSGSDCNEGERAEAVWEVKFVMQLSNQHVVQACAYAFLLGLPSAILFNVRDGEKWIITSRNGQEGLHRMLEEILRAKHTSSRKMSDEEFTAKCAEKTRELMKLE
ncbi:hypothetical protein Neosp_007822 [[Neocosmospora] mangrovei]